MAIVKGAVGDQNIWSMVVVWFLMGILDLVGYLVNGVGIS